MAEGVADWGLIAARALMLIALLFAAGLPTYALSAGQAVSAARRLRLPMALLALAGAAASVWWALASVAAMAGTAIAALDQQTVFAVLGATPLGQVLALRLALLSGVLFIALVPFRRGSVPLWAALASAALATSAWTGHAGASEGALGSLHRIADALHLLAAATWLAALTVLLAGALGKVQTAELERRLARFSAAGTVIVATLLVTGTVSALAIAGWPLAWSGWAELLALKLALFGAMLGLAALNRWRLTPALAAAAPGARARLRRSLVLETALGLGVIAVVAVLGLLDPSA